MGQSFKYSYGVEVDAFVGMITKLTVDNVSSFAIKTARNDIIVTWYAPQGQRSPLGWDYWVSIGQSTTLSVSMYTLLPSAGDNTSWIASLPTWVTNGKAYHRTYKRVITSRLRPFARGSSPLIGEVDTIVYIVNCEIAQGRDYHRLIADSEGNYLDITWDSDDAEPGEVINYVFFIQTRGHRTDKMDPLALLPSRDARDTWTQYMHNYSSQADLAALGKAYRKVMRLRIAACIETLKAGPITSPSARVGDEDSPVTMHMDV